MGMPHHTERTKTILKLRTEDGLTYQAIADMFNVSKQHIQKVVSGYDQAPAEKNEDEYDVWEVAELTGFAREWIRRNCKKVTSQSLLGQLEEIQHIITGIKI